MDNEPVKMDRFLIRMMMSVVGLIWLLAAILALSIMYGCEGGRRLGVTSVGQVPVMTKFVPPYFDEYGTIIAVRDDPEASPIGWLLHESGIFGLAAVDYFVRCPSRPPQFGAYEFTLYKDRANFSSGPAMLSVGVLPADGQTFSGPLTHSYFGPEAGVTGGRFTATFSREDSTLRGVAYLVVSSPCNPPGSPPDSSFQRPFILVADWHRPKLWEL